MRVDDAFDDVERPDLAAGRNEFLRRREVFAIREVHLVQQTVAGYGVDRVLTGCGCGDVRCCRLAAGAKYAAVFERAIVAGSAAELLLPEDRAGVDVDGE